MGDPWCDVLARFHSNFRPNHVVEAYYDVKPMEKLKKSIAFYLKSFLTVSILSPSNLNRVILGVFVKTIKESHLNLNGAILG